MIKMNESWQNWCRFCAKCDSSELGNVYKMESIEEQMEIVKEYFSIVLLPFSRVRSMCSECYAFLNKVQKFRDHCLRVDAMFNELVINENSTNIQTIRSKYGFDNEEDELSSQLMLHLDESEEETDKKTWRNNSTSDHYSDTLKNVKIKLEEIEEVIELIDNEDEEDYEEAIYEQNEYVDESESVALSNPSNTTWLKEEFLEGEQDDQPAIKHDRRQFKKTSPSKVAKKTRKRKKKVLKSNFRETCKICQKSYVSLIGFQQHMMAKHSELQELAIHQCTECPKKFVARQLLISHQKSHLPEEEKKLFHCESCLAKFSAKSSLKIHINTIHKNEKKFICDICGKTFGTKGNLSEHCKIHGDDWPFQCAYCPRKFKTAANMKIHEEIHTDTKFKCPHCDVLANTKRSLRFHLLVHTDEKKYKCKYCSRTFKRPTALKYHLHQHTGYKPYPCQYCDSAYTSKINLEGHQKKNHPFQVEAVASAVKAE
ncbi:zinc finger protein 184-like [Lutzomyia longipalpis]|uniref:zinc finger protein 184-like n=1 Tax=Lutzomyia longipalpis TaxID=7200 RepID=UPI0024833A89|nr:zinc finger protein 184-like [Lutzomyia longipalpis]